MMLKVTLLICSIHTVFHWILIIEKQTEKKDHMNAETQQKTATKKRWKEANKQKNCINQMEILNWNLKTNYGSEKW